PVADAEAAAARRAALAGRRIAILSPHAIEAGLMQRALENAGAGVSLHATRDEAVAACRAGPKGATTLVIDNRIPGGAAAFLDGGSPPARLVALIGAGERNATGAQFKQAGHAFLTRPVRPATLLRVLTNTAEATAAVP